MMVNIQLKTMNDKIFLAIYDDGLKKYHISHLDCVYLRQFVKEIYELGVKDGIMKAQSEDEKII